MFDIFEPDTRGGTESETTASTICDFVAAEASPSPTMFAKTPSIDYAPESTKEAVPVVSKDVLARCELYAGDIYIGSFDDFATDDKFRDAKGKTTDICQSPTIYSEECKEPLQAPLATAAVPAKTLQDLVDRGTSDCAHVTTSCASEPPTASSSTSDDPTQHEAQRLLESITFCDHHPDQNLIQLRDLIGSYGQCAEEAADAIDGTFNSVTKLEWEIRQKKAYISLAVREQENRKRAGENRDPAEENRPKPTRSFQVHHGKNATDPSICNHPECSEAVLTAAAELQEAVEGWRDTIDGTAEDTRDVASGTQPRQEVERDDCDGIDNNDYHDYFPDVPIRAIYHSTAAQTKMVMSPMLYEKLYGREPTRAEARKTLRMIGSLEYVDQSEIWYGKPFVNTDDQDHNTKAKTRDSGFQTMDFEIREANILKSKAKAGIIASKINKISLERDNGIRVFAEPLKDRVVHSQQFNAVRAVIDKAGTVESYGSFTPMIHNVVYEELHQKPVTTITKARAASIDRCSGKNYPRPIILNLEVKEPKHIPTYCRSPSPGLYESVQNDLPESFENGWPVYRFPIKEVDGTYSHDVSKDFGLPNSKQRSKPTCRIARAATPPKTAVPHINGSMSKQKTPDAHLASKAYVPSITTASLSNPKQQGGQSRSQKRTSDQVPDEGYKSDSPSDSSHKRQKMVRGIAESSSHFPMPYNTPVSSKDVIVLTPTSHQIPKTKDTSAPSAQISRKRARDEAPVQEPLENTPNSKRPRLELAPKPIRRLPPTESTLKVINPKGDLKTKVPVKQEDARPTLPKADRTTHSGDTKTVLLKEPTQKPVQEPAQKLAQTPTQTPVLPVPATSASAKKENTRPVLPKTGRVTQLVNANTTTSKTLSTKPAQKKVQLPVSAAPVPAATPAPAPAPSRPAWANRKPTANRDGKKENPNRWRINLSAAGLGDRHDPYNARGRPGRQN